MISIVFYSPHNYCRYAKAVQSTTLDSIPQLISGFLGYTSAFFGLDSEEGITLQLYAVPKYIARFVGYLQARGVGIGQIAKHVALCRKINDYLQSGAGEGSPVRLHATKMEAWLARLLAQLHASNPSRPSAEYPDINLTWRWVEQLVDGALSSVEDEMWADGCIGHRTASRVLQALVAALITGCYCPPCRIHVLLSLIHPKYNSRIPCTDRDCLQGADCIGNHLKLFQITSHGTSLGVSSLPGPSTLQQLVMPSESSWEHFQYKSTGVKLVIVHHKTDR